MKVEVSEDTLISTWEYSRSDTWKIPLSPHTWLGPPFHPHPRTLLGAKEPGERHVDSGFPKTHFGPCRPCPFPLVLPEMMDGHVERNTLWERLLLDVSGLRETWLVYGLAVKWGCCRWWHPRPLPGSAFCVQGRAHPPSTAGGRCKRGFVLCLQFILQRQKLSLGSLLT